ncbi:hypothetical protein EPR50_G00112630 [Perca flavescens]|uniref:Uncharacterized protein n=1 Tax=Perca flavescens TaxID=8167 RepID=A0A484CYG5_PERFV|nr:hypothetical protein EPR50_G00112630 [Perca flavescens]
MLHQHSELHFKYVRFCVWYIIIFNITVFSYAIIFQMENTETSTEQAISTACIDLENILKGLDSLSNCMDQLALRTQQRQCDLIVCVGHPDKLAFSENPRGTEASAPRLT